MEKKKVLLIGFFTRTYMPYIDKYESALKANGIGYEMVFFDRDSSKREIKHNGNEYTFCHKTTTNKFKKILPVFKYICFVKKILRRNTYQKVIVMTTMPAVLLLPELLRHFDHNYIYDYRDTTYEQWFFFRRIVKKIIDHSYFTAVSSKGYENILGKHSKIIFNHNLSNAAYKESSAPELNMKPSINIGFLGYIRYFDINSRLINALKKNERYHLMYAGTAFSDCDLVSYAKDIGADNISFYGKFENRDKPQLYKKIDMINSLYSLDSPEVRYAVPNRIYDAALFKKPIIVTEGTYLSEIVKNCHLGLVINPYSDDIEEKINDYIASYNHKEFESACEIFLEKIFNDERNLSEAINSFLIG